MLCLRYSTSAVSSIYYLIRVPKVVDEIEDLQGKNPAKWNWGDMRNSLTVHTTGQSGHAGHPHYADMVDMWRNIEYYPMYWEQDSVIGIAKRICGWRPTPLCPIGHPPREAFFRANSKSMEFRGENLIFSHKTSEV